MDNLLNSSRPPAFCPGCSYEHIVHALDKTFGRMGLDGNRIVLVTDIGCCGLFDVFFNTHAFHGLHGRALTYATGLRLACPDMHVIVIMGDGGLGIGGAHFLSSCRRNLDLTLLVLNNFNYGMTGGQCSVTTPPEAHCASGFLNQLDAPLDICRLADAAGAPFVIRTSALAADLAEQLETAIRFTGFSVLDIHGICTGRYARRNRITSSMIEQRISQSPKYIGLQSHNMRREYGSYYRELAARQKRLDTPLKITPISKAPLKKKTGILILGSAGQRIATAGELLALAGIAGGLSASQKNSHDITVLRGASISEVILQPEPIAYTGIDLPEVIFALGQEGVDRKMNIFSNPSPDSLIVQACGVEIPACKTKLLRIDFKKHSIKKQDWALAALGMLAAEGRMITLPLLRMAITSRFEGTIRDNALKLITLARISHEHYVNLSTP